jgi:uncharacterized protein (DUF983 family)
MTFVLLAGLIVFTIVGLWMFVKHAANASSWRLFILFCVMVITMALLWFVIGYYIALNYK